MSSARVPRRSAAASSRKTTLPSIDSAQLPPGSRRTNSAMALASAGLRGGRLRRGQHVRLGAGQDRVAAALGLLQEHADAVAAPDDGLPLLGRQLRGVGARPQQHEPAPVGGHRYGWARPPGRTGTAGRARRAGTGGPAPPGCRARSDTAGVRRRPPASGRTAAPGSTASASWPGTPESTARCRVVSSRGSRYSIATDAPVSCTTCVTALPSSSVPEPVAATEAAWSCMLSSVPRETRAAHPLRVAMWTHRGHDTTWTSEGDPRTAAFSCVGWVTLTVPRILDPI